VSLLLQIELALYTAPYPCVSLKLWIRKVRLFCA